MTNVRKRRGMLTVGDVASLLNVNINTVRRWTNKGILKTYRIGPRGDRRFRREDIGTFLLKQLERDAHDEHEVYDWLSNDTKYHITL